VHINLLTTETCTTLQLSSISAENQRGTEVAKLNWQMFPGGKGTHPGYICTSITQHIIKPTQLKDLLFSIMLLKGVLLHRHRESGYSVHINNSENTQFICTST
jgi:hypothetical protein